MARDGLVAHRTAAQVLHYVRIQTAASTQRSLCRRDTRAYSAQAAGWVAAHADVMCQDMACEDSPLRAFQLQDLQETGTSNQTRMMWTRLRPLQPLLWA